MTHAAANPFGFEAEYSQAVVLTGQSIITSGQASTDSEGQLIVDDFAGQARRTFENLERVLSAAGSSLEQVVQLTVFLLRAQDMPTFREVRREFVSVPFPAITAVVVAAFPLEGMLLQVQAAAVTGEFEKAS
jgi:2-iminobutanoate/2-iminopropanoate deaminase